MRFRVPLLMTLLTLIATHPCRAVDRQLIASRANQLQKMSPIERDRLNRNIAEFRKLSDAEKEHFRKLHRELKADAASGGNLTTLLQTYSVWVQTLTPTQRDELQKESNLSHRFALVRKFKEEQEEPGEPVESNPPIAAELVTDENVKQLNTVFTKREALVPKDLKSVLKVLTDDLDKQHMQPAFENPDLAAFIPLIHASVQSIGGDYQTWPEQKLLQEMIGSLNKETAQTFSKLNPNSKRDVMVRMLLLGVMKQARDEVKFPTEDEKLQILKEMKPAEREWIMNQSAARMKIYLIRKSMELRGEEALSDFKQIPEYHKQIEELFERFEVAPPPRFLGKTRKNSSRQKK
ncbi:hypothetical protein [Schlesneria sp.]|uniref:hypothetical protein n=1 Tax=Schlesneria sp. TaxID=2762018 RepID=UPI002F174033